MCGIAGFFWREGTDHRQISQLVSESLTHRGPDSFGHWDSVEAGATLIHRRLAILDLSHDGHQPMISSSGRYVTTFNGEIYNFSELKKTLALLGYRFKGTSDTEVILAGVEQWGVPEMLERCAGMFAFVIWDTAKHELWMSRDRLGEKPLYYGWIDGNLCFASELKAIEKFSPNRLSISRQSLQYYLQFGRVPAPFSIYEGVYKLPPGCVLKLSLADCRKRPDNFSPSPESSGPRPLRYWDPMRIALALSKESLITDEETALDECEKLLRNAIQLQMIADVPIGAFLSGGIDSSLIVALMQQQSKTPVNTFTIGFGERDYDEAPFARAVAAHLRTNHFEMYVSPQEVIETIPHIPEIFDEPLADQSQVPTYLLAKLARQNVTVALSGDGGDELFGGYDRQIVAPKIEKIMHTIPYPIRVLIGRAVTLCPPEMLSQLAHAISYRRASSLDDVKHIGSKLHKLADILAARSEIDLYVRSSSHWSKPGEVLRESQSLPQLLTNFSGCWPVQPSIAQSFMNLDLTHYLPDDILGKLDRATMAVSLESRAPFLDHKLVEYSFRLDSSLKIRAGKGKWLLRRMLANHLPEHLFNRPKSGFTMPIANWLRAELRPWAEHLLSPERLASSGYFDVKTVQKTWQDHLSGKRDFHNKLWNLLMFEAWRERVRL